MRLGTTVLSAVAMVFVAACSQSGDVLTVEAYSAQLSAAYDISDTPPPNAEESRSTERTVMAFIEIERGLDELRSMNPPADLAVAHGELVETLADVQEAAREYLQSHGLTESDISPADVGRYLEESRVVPAARRACATISALLRDLGAPLEGEICVV